MGVLFVFWLVQTMMGKLKEKFTIEIIQHQFSELFLCTQQKLIEKEYKTNFFFLNSQGNKVHFGSICVQHTKGKKSKRTAKNKHTYRHTM
jgi:hypothetical protein